MWCIGKYHDYLFFFQSWVRFPNVNICWSHLHFAYLPQPSLTARIFLPNGKGIIPSPLTIHLPSSCPPCPLPPPCPTSPWSHPALPGPLSVLSSPLLPPTLAHSHSMATSPALASRLSVCLHSPSPLVAAMQICDDL